MIVQKMKRLFTLLLVLALASLVSCGIGSSSQKTEQVKSIKALNDTIDSEINELVSLYRNSSASLDDIKSASNTIITIDDNVGELKGELISFNKEYINELTFDSDMFNQYEEIISDLTEWKDDLVDNYSNNSDLGDTYRITYNSNQAIIISNRYKLIENYKPDYQSLINE